MKVLFASGYNPFCVGSGPGGCLYYLSSTLAAMGCEVHILTPKIDSEQDLARGVTIHYYDDPVKRSNFGKSWIAFSLFSVKQIKHICDNYGIDIVNGHSPTTFTYSMLRNGKVPFIVSAHGTSFGEISSIYNTPHEYLDKSSIRDALLIQPVWGGLTSIEYKFASKVIAVSGSVADELVNYYHVDKQKVGVIHNGVTGTHYDEPIQENLILSVGRMVWRKGFLYLINAMPSVLEEYPNAKLLLIGEGYYRQKLMEQVKNLNLQHSVSFSGCIPKTELFRLFNKCHVYVQPSLYEPLGNTILEAMVSQKPVIASRVGGIPEIIAHGENGLLVEPCNSTQIAQSIKLLLSDANYSKRISKKAKETMVKSFSWETIAQKTLKFFEQSIDQQ